MKQKILIIANYQHSIGGISVQVDLLHTYLNSEQGCIADVFSLKGSIVKRIFLILKLLITARKYDVLHIHACSDRGFLPAIVSAYVGKFYRKRTILTYHGGGADAFFAKKINLVRNTLCKFDSVIVLSGYLKKIFDYYNLPCITIPNIAEFDANLYRVKTNIEPKFISVRHLRELYNVKCILKAFEKVKKVIPSATLTILGDGDQKEMLQYWVIEHNLKDVIFVGAVPHDKMNEYLSQNDIFLSAPKTDNMPMSILEAYNAGLLVISSNVGGVPYILKNNETGLLFESDNAEELAVKMIQAVQNKQRSIEMIHSAYQSLDMYKWENIREKLYKLYS
jgi:glycosyltransferase involved in cell wall biosynthesis